MITELPSDRNHGERQKNSADTFLHPEILHCIIFRSYVTDSGLHDEDTDLFLFYYFNPRTALRISAMDVTSTVNSAQAPLRHTEGSA